MKEFVDRWAMYGAMCDAFFKNELFNPMKVVRDAPSVDAVEVVRCKNCCNSRDCDDEVFCEMLGAYLSKDDFCSRGEERR